MKIAVIGDTHYGARSDHLILLDFFKKFLDDIFFPTLKKHQIDTVIHLGDLVDRRKYINIHTAHRLKTDFLDKLKGKDVHIILGNHDSFYKDTNRINVLDELFSGYRYHLYTSPSTLTLKDGKEILIIPWIAPDIEHESLEAIKNSKANICMGHLELKGFEMHRGSYCESGLDPNVFNRFDIVLSGHFHHKSTYQNINYLGSPYEMTWADYNDVKGFHIFDTDTLELEFIANPFKLFHKIVYDDESKDFDQIFNEIDFKQYANTYVKVIVRSKSNAFWYDQFIQRLEDSGVFHIQAVDDHLNLSIDNDEIVNEAESTIDILNKSIKNLGIKPEYEIPLEQLLRMLYNEANILQS